MPDQGLSVPPSTAAKVGGAGELHSFPPDSPPPSRMTAVYQACHAWLAAERAGDAPAIERTWRAFVGECARDMLNRPA